MNWSKLNSSSGLIVASAAVPGLVVVNAVRVRTHAAAKAHQKVRAVIVRTVAVVTVIVLANRVGAILHR